MIIVQNISELKIVACKTKDAIISVLETWLDDSVNDTEFWIENYTIVWKYRSKMAMKYVTISEMTFLSPSESELESIWI